MANQPCSDHSSGHDYNLWHILISTGFSSLADQIGQLTFVWSALKLGHHGLYVALVLGAYTVPLLLLMLVGGWVGDRWPRGTLIIASLALAVLAFVMSQIVLSAAVLMAGALTAGLADSFRTPVGQSIIAFAVPSHQLQSANQLRQIRFQLTRLAGPVLAGLLIAHFGVSGSFLSAFALYFIGGASLWGSRLEYHHKKRQTPGLHNGLNRIRQTPVLLWMMIFFGLSNLAWFGPLQATMPSMVRDVLHGGALAYGMVTAAFGGGLLTGSLVLGHLQFRNIPNAMFAFMTTSDVILACSAFTHALWELGLVLGVGGLVFAPAGILYNTFIQQRVGSDGLSQVFAVSSLFLQGLGPLSLAIVGGLSFISPPIILMSAGIAGTLADGSGWILIHSKKWGG